MVEALTVTHREATELRALVLQAWELRDSPYLVDAAASIIEWHERRSLVALEREQACEAAHSALAAAYPGRYGRAAA